MTSVLVSVPKISSLTEAAQLSYETRKACIEHIAMFWGYSSVVGNPGQEDPSWDVGQALPSEAVLINLDRCLSFVYLISLPFSSKMPHLSGAGACSRLSQTR